MSAHPDAVSHGGRIWQVSPRDPGADTLAREARIPRIVAQVLVQRGVTDPDAVAEFLSPSLRGMHPPEALPNAVEAARRLAAAARDGRRVVIYGDYDVDGMTATAILWHGLKLAGAEVDYYIPRRLEEGYGLNMQAIEQLADEGADLVITVDCGVTAVEQAARARELGLELIITDHHQPGPRRPDALIVHPTAEGASPNEDLSGAGVALKIAWAFAQQYVRPGQKVSPAFRAYLLDATALAALGLVADVVPLTGENRVIVAFGLRHLLETRNPGLNALIEVSGLRGKRSFDDYDVGFRLAPRLNAIGRMGHAAVAVELFTDADPQRAHEIATQLDQLNLERREVQEQIVAEAEKMVVAAGYNQDHCRGIVLAAPNWHPGVIGIVASRMVEKFHRPTVLIASQADGGQGSGRSIPHFPLHEVLRNCEEHLISHGGHAMAAGVRVHPDQIEAFTNAFLTEASRRLTEQDLQPRLRLDDELDLGELTPDVVDWLQRLAPYGPGNARPKFATPVVDLVDQPRKVGNGQHLQFSVRQGNVYRKAIAFYQGESYDALAEQRRVRVAFEPIINDWNGNRRVELKVSDWQAV